MVNKKHLISNKHLNKALKTILGNNLKTLLHFKKRTIKKKSLIYLVETFQKHSLLSLPKHTTGSLKCQLGFVASKTWAESRNC